MRDASLSPPSDGLNVPTTSSDKVVKSALNLDTASDGLIVKII